MSVPWSAWVIVGWYGGWSLIAAVLIVLDKRAARRGTWRIPERRLHAVEWLGGWPGSYLARRTVRHKTQKLSYRVRAGLALIAHLALWGVVIWRVWFA